MLGVIDRESHTSSPRDPSSGRHDAHRKSCTKYLADVAPHLLPHAEYMSHWCGFYSISPKLLLAIIEMRSGLVSARNVTAAVRLGIDAGYVIGPVAPTLRVSWQGRSINHGGVGGGLALAFRW